MLQQIVFPTCGYELVGAGANSIFAIGPVKSRAHMTVPTPTFPRASVDVTVKLCGPTDRSVNEKSRELPLEPEAYPPLAFF